jgi:DNA-binding transcriptional LysR family regulator
MALRELKGFVAVVEEGGMSAAARRLHVSQSALSQTITNLEREVGVKLLVRSSTGVRPTAAGKTLLGEARAVLARHAQAVRTMADYTSDGSGVIRLGIPLELPPSVLPATLSRFGADCPRARIASTHMSTAA